MLATQVKKENGQWRAVWLDLASDLSAGSELKRVGEALLEHAQKLCAFSTLIGDTKAPLALLCAARSEREQEPSLGAGNRAELSVRMLMGGSGAR